MKTNSIFIVITFMLIAWNFSDGKIINIPNDYPTIQQGIDAADSSDIINVLNGVYKENLLINKPLTLQGEDSSKTIIDGNFKGHVIDIRSDKVIISNLLIRNSDTSEYNFAGIQVLSSKNNEMNSCYLYNHYNAILFYNTDSSIISNCLIKFNNNGISFNEYITNDTSIIGANNNNRIFSNVIDSNITGINFTHTLTAHHKNNIIKYNTITSNNIGIDIIMSYVNRFFYNTIKDNKSFGIRTIVCEGGGGGNVFHRNSLINNNNKQKHVQSTPEDIWYLDGVGNYWDDYTGHDADGDGIGEEPYFLYQGKEDTLADFYPLTEIRKCPLLTFPINNSSSQDTTMIFEWEEEETVAEYQIEISKDHIFSEDSIIYSGLSNQNNKHSILLEKSKTYYWRVRVANNDSMEYWSYPWKFSTGMLPPTLISPDNMSSNLDTTVIFKWQTYDNAEKYIIQIAKEKSFNAWLNIVYTGSTLTDNQYIYDKLKFNSKYFWRVRVQTGEIYSYWSEVRQFTTATNPIQLSRPPNNSTQYISARNQTIDLNWSANNDIDFYNVEIARDELFNDKIICDTIKHYLYKFKNPKPELDSTYYWHVRAFRGGLEIPCSETWKFKVGLGGSLEEPILIYPKNGSQLQEVVVKLLWTNSFGAQNYKVRIYTDDNNKFLVYENNSIKDTNILVDDLQINTKYSWSVTAVRDSIEEISQRRYFTTGSKTDVKESIISSDFPISLSPNPFYDYTEITFNLEKPSFIKIKVVNLMGMEIQDLYNGFSSESEFRIRWEPENLSQGIYFLILEIDNMRVTKPIIYQTSD